MPFGLVGLAQVWAIAESYGISPAGVTDALWILAAAVWALACVLYFRRPRDVRADVLDNIGAPFIALAVVVPMPIAANGLEPRAHTAAVVLVDVFLVLTLLYGGWLTGQWIYGPIDPPKIHPGYFLPTVAGGLVASAAATGVGQRRLGEFMFGLGVICWLVIGSIILNRLFVRSLLPPPLIPTLAIEVAPAPVASLAYFALNGFRIDAFDLSERLLARACEFDFFQAVRLLEWMAWEAESQGQPARAPVGEDGRPDRELVRFRVPPTTGFAAAAVGTLTDPSQSASGTPGQPLELTISFLGLIGASGVLPLHYSAETISRSQNQDRALQEFFDIFQHRATSLFYRAWRKYRLPSALERTTSERLRPGRESTATDDPFGFALRCLVGLGTEGLANRLDVADETAVFYAGHFTHAPRSALALERMLADYFGQAAQVQQFSGRWLMLPPDQRTAMPAGGRPGNYSALGRTAVVGARVWDVQTRFRVRLGPMSYREFLEFLPGGEALARLADLVRLYSGPALEFEVQPVLRRDEVPTARLGAAGGGKSMLTRNSWLASRPRTRDADEAVFQP